MWTLNLIRKGLIYIYIYIYILIGPWFILYVLVAADYPGYIYIYIYILCWDWAAIPRPPFLSPGAKGSAAVFGGSFTKASPVSLFASLSLSLSVACSNAHKSIVTARTEDRRADDDSVRAETLSLVRAFTLFWILIAGVQLSFQIQGPSHKIIKPFV